MRAEPVLAEPEHAVPDRERRDALADLGDLPGELAAEDRRLRLGDAAEEANDPGLGGAEAAVRPVHRRGADPNKDLARSGHRWRDLRDRNDLRRAVPGAHRSLHGRTLFGLD